MEEYTPQDGSMGVVRLRPSGSVKQPAPPPSAPGSKVVRSSASRPRSLMNQPLGSLEDAGVIPKLFKSVLDLAQKNKDERANPVKGGYRPASAGWSSQPYNRVHPSHRDYAEKPNADLMGGLSGLGDYSEKKPSKLADWTSSMIRKVQAAVGSEPEPKGYPAVGSSVRRARVSDPSGRSNSVSNRTPRQSDPSSQGPSSASLVKGTNSLRGSIPSFNRDINVSVSKLEPFIPGEASPGSVRPERSSCPTTSSATFLEPVAMPGTRRMSVPDDSLSFSAGCENGSRPNSRIELVNVGSRRGTTTGGILATVEPRVVSRSSVGYTNGSGAPASSQRPVPVASVADQRQHSVSGQRPSSARRLGMVATVNV